MEIFNYHPDTFEFLGIAQADPDPLQEGHFLIPAFSTIEPPPAIGPNKVAVFQNNIWYQKDDYRGTEYWLEDGSHHRITKIGEIPPSNALFSKPEEPISTKRSNAKQNIDAAAGNARARYVSSGQLLEEEYRLALQQTQNWRSAGNPADQVPPAIQDWATAAGLTPEQAATDIEQTAAAWESVLLYIRQVRLMGKAAVDAAEDNANFSAIAQSYIDQLDVLQP